MAWELFYYQKTEERLIHLDALVHRLIHLVETQSGLIEQLLAQGEKIMPTLDEVLADVQSEKDEISSLTAFIAGLRQQIADALLGQGISAEAQAKIDAIFAGVEANKQAIHDAMVTPPPTPEPPPQDPPPQT